ncbi:MAG: B12-binding domain-containing radical SAM protein [Rikenellaceae bacterium]
MRFCLITPPFVQLNTPYPATTQLKAYLRQRGHDVLQCDIGIEVAERIFCREFLEGIFHQAFESERLSPASQGVAMRKEEYLRSIDATWRFLRGDDPSLSTRIASRGFLPEGAQFKAVNDEDLEWAYGTTGTAERAKYIATLYIEDLAGFIAEVTNCDFSIIRYKEQIAMSAPTFDAIYNDLQQEPNIIERLTLDILNEKLTISSPDVVGFSIPFPGTLIMALRMAQQIKLSGAKMTIAMGGGYVNTELRTVSDPRLFEFIDFLLFDDGELPISTLAEHLTGKIERKDIVSAKYIDNNIVTDSANWDNAIDFDTLPPADFSDLKFEKYISLVEFTNPMHRLWSDGKWNKMTLAHGCYHARCTFCDTNLDYIGRYSPAKASTVVDRMESIMAQTGVSGFHFTDEALPPKLLREISIIIIKRGLVVSFWGNIRFEKRFDLELCELLAKAGCIAVSGGLEVASPRILKLIEKGVTIEQAIESCTAFNNAGIMVHAYLMYGFPTQTEVEAIESLEIVRQMFEQGVVQSAFWHCYAMTVHSPTGCNPERYNSQITGSTHNPFANNGIEFTDHGSADWHTIGRGLKTATQNFMQGRGYDMPIKSWFGKRFKNPQIARNLVEKIIDRYLS